MRTWKRRRLSGLDAASQGAVWSIACLQFIELHVSMDCQRDLATAICVAADGSGQRDDCYDLGDAMDNLQGLRFHMPCRQWQMLDDMVAAKLRADAAPGHAAQAGVALARPAPAAEPGHGAGRPRKQVELLKRENRLLKQVVCRLRGLVRRLRAELQAKIGEMRAKTSVLKMPERERAARRATERRVVSLAGGYRCALLRNIGHAVAGAVVAHLDAGIARQTVCRWEQLLGANVLAHARAFYNDQYTQLRAARSAEVREPSRAGWTWEVQCFARRRHQLEHPARIESSRVRGYKPVHHALDTDDFGADGDHDRPSNRTYCDLIKIEGSCDGPLQHAIWLKQVQSIGVRMWRQVDLDAACAAGNHVMVWVFTTDQGPDQVAASRLLERDVEESVTDIVIAQWCSAHVLHLTVKFQVQHLYNGKYFGSLAKVVNLWRSRGNPKKIREGLRQYHHDHGDRATDTRARKLPPRPLTGRWGAVSNTEIYLRSFTQDELLSVWEERLVL